MEKLMKNRKLILNEYDDDGNIIASQEVSEKMFSMAMMSWWNYGDILDIPRVAIRNKYNEKEWSRITELFYYIYANDRVGTNRYPKFDEIDEDFCMYISIFLAMEDEKYKFIMSISRIQGCVFNTKLASPYAYKEYGLQEAIEFIAERDGIYYTVDNKGNRVYDFVDRPTLKQAKYQRTKNGNRTVFLDFGSWKEYIVNECDLV